MTLNAEDGDGLTPNHWLNSTIIFSLIINLVCLKLFVETNQWSVISVLAGIVSLITYYLALVLG
jgi:hypothetical protein